ncbi:MAG: bifunctional DNA-formamidopyrimidine glycosylase/DNA-(apurinic or apyrimidinic site) lyase [Acidimicrobiales bacterium]|nr:bifunctional DNA-formamidopyrimidine glycosylase/DNA-(apurinic or apyrimidinic site) lyase [Acidimicrobiales bacterium]
MPELPEVETVRRTLEPRVLNRAVLEAGSHWSQKFTPAVTATDAKITSLGRRGKFLVFSLHDAREMIVHLGMTGVISFAAPSADLDSPYLRAWWHLEETEDHPSEILLFNDVRRFGRIRVVPAGDYSSIPTLAAAGPEPWDPDLTASSFHRSIQASSRAIKTQLLSQRPIAGVGNIYADEALWAARINPSVRRLGRQRAGDLLIEIRVALEKGLANGGTTLKDYRNADGAEGSNQRSLLAYGRAGLPCSRCQTTLVSGVIDARTTVWCPRCQRR